MSIGASEKEFIFHLWLKTRKERLEQVLGARMSHIQLEQPIDTLQDRSRSGNAEKKKPVDMYAVDSFGLPVLVESVLARSNGAHQEAVLRLIDYLDAGRVVYQALSFQDKHVTELRKVVETSGKPICLYLIEIDEGVLKPIQFLDQLNKLAVWDHLSLVDSILQPLRLVEKVESPQFHGIQPVPILNRTYDYSVCREALNQFMIMELERCIPEFFPFHRGKSRLENRVVTFGAGAGDLMYHCSACDSRGYGFVELRFGNRSDLYNLIVSKPRLLEAKIDQRVYVRDSTVGVQFPASSDQIANVREIVRIFRAFIVNVSRPLYDLLSFEHEVKGMRTRIA